MDMWDHLEKRHMQMHRYHYSLTDDICDFFLFTTTGQIVGFHRYRPNCEKNKRNDQDHGRYYTYFTGSKFEKEYSVWGMETFNYRNDILFVCEGIFKAVMFHNRGYPAVATLSNNAKHLKNWLFMLSQSRRVVFVGDNDGEHSKTKSLGFPMVFPPKKFKDVDDMTDDEFNLWFEGEGFHD